MNRSMRIWGLIVLLPALAGCTPVYLRVQNNLSESILVTSGHTGHTHRVKPRKERNLPHGQGGVDIHDVWGKNLKDEADIRSRERLHESHYFFWHKVVVPLEVNAGDRKAPPIR